MVPLELADRLSLAVDPRRRAGVTPSTSTGSTPARGADNLVLRAIARGAAGGRWRLAGGRAAAAARRSA